MNVQPSVQNLAMSALTGENKAKAEKSKEGGGGSWFESLAKAWGEVLDNQAGKLEELSAKLEGDDSPSAVTELTAASMKMSFLAQSEQTSVSSAGQALETSARK